MLGRRTAARAAAAEAGAVLAKTAPDQADEIARWLRSDLDRAMT